MAYDLYSQLESFNTKLTINAMAFLMESGELMKAPKGTIISKEGENSEHVYMIVEGSAEVEKCDDMGGKITIARIEQGGLIGEMGVFLDMKRTATVKAAEDLTLIKFTNEHFINALPKTPDITIRLLKSLAEKVAAANHRFSELTAKNAMLTVGLYLLEQPEDQHEACIDVTQISEDAGLAPGKVVSALKSMQKQKLISQWRLEEGKLLRFTIHHQALRRTLQQLDRNTETVSL